MSLTSVNVSFEDLFKQAIEMEVRRIVDSSIENAKKKLEQELKDSADRIALAVSSLYSIERIGTTLRIEVKKLESES